MNELERRLSTWQPTVAGLDPDALLFAAGRASVRPGATRFVWPALTVCVSLLAIALGVWLAEERTERLNLARQLRQQSQLLATNPSPSPASDPTPARVEEDPPADSYLASLRALDKGLEAWPISSVIRADPPGPKPPHSPVLKAGRLDALLDP
jgi:hypothetical protein